MAKRLGWMLSAVAVVALAGSLAAQEIVVISGNTVVIRDAQGAHRYTMLPESKLMVDGKDLTVRELKPGMHVAAAPTGPGETVVVTQVREGKILEVSGTNLIVRDQDGVKRYIVDPDFKVVVDGKESSVTSLRPGMVLTAMIVTKGSPTVDSAMAASDAKAARSTSETRRTTTEQADAGTGAHRSARRLPKTASSLPLLGLLGLASLASGLTLRAARLSRAS
jgi:hypothetical protein